VPAVAGSGGVRKVARAGAAPAASVGGRPLLGREVQRRTAQRSSTSRAAQDGSKQPATCREACPGMNSAAGAALPVMRTPGRALKGAGRAPVLRTHDGVDGCGFLCCGCRGTPSVTCVALEDCGASCTLLLQRWQGSSLLGCRFSLGGRVIRRPPKLRRNDPSQPSVLTPSPTPAEHKHSHTRRTALEPRVGAAVAAAVQAPPFWRPLRVLLCVCRGVVGTNDSVCEGEGAGC
jgi:hypothetical protein